MVRTTTVFVASYLCFSPCGFFRRSAWVKCLTSFLFFFRVQLGLHDKPIGLLNIANYWGNLIDWVCRTILRVCVIWLKNNVLALNEPETAFGLSLTGSSVTFCTWVWWGSGGGRGYSHIFSSGIANFFPIILNYSWPCLGAKLCTPCRFITEPATGTGSGNIPAPFVIFFNN